MRRQHEEFGIRAVSVFPAGTFPQVAIDDPKMYPVYQACVDLGIPIFCTAGVPGPRLKYAVQDVSRIDVVMYDFPELVFVTRHGCEPWEELAAKLMLKWPNLYYSTSRLRAQVLPRGDREVREHPGWPTRSSTAATFPMGLVPRADLLRTCRTCPSGTKSGRSFLSQKRPAASSSWTPSQAPRWM